MLARLTLEDIQIPRLLLDRLEHRSEHPHHPDRIVPFDTNDLTHVARLAPIRGVIHQRGQRRHADHGAHKIRRHREPRDLIGVRSQERARSPRHGGRVADLIPERERHTTSAIVELHRGVPDAYPQIRDRPLLRLRREMIQQVLSDHRSISTV